MSIVRAVASGMLVMCATTVLACGGGQDTHAGAGESATGAPVMAPAVPQAAIVAPAEGDSVSGDSLKVTMSVTGAKLVNAKEATVTKVPFEGHLHLFIDKDVTPATAAIPTGDPMMVHLGTGATEYVIPKLTPGAHRIILVFAFSDHTPDVAVASDTVNIIVR